TFQRQRLPVNLHIPDPCGIVFTSCEDAFAIRRDDRADITELSIENQYLPARRNIPDLDRIIVASYDLFAPGAKETSVAPINVCSSRPVCISRIFAFLPSLLIIRRLSGETAIEEIHPVPALRVSSLSPVCASQTLILVASISSFSLPPVMMRL